MCGVVFLMKVSEQSFNEAFFDDMKGVSIDILWNFWYDKRALPSHMLDRYIAFPKLTYATLNISSMVKTLIFCSASQQFSCQGAIR